jgi:hypothetical protein
MDDRTPARLVQFTLISCEDPEIVEMEAKAIEEALMEHDESIWLSCTWRIDRTNLR